MGGLPPEGGRFLAGKRQGARGLLSEKTVPVLSLLPDRASSEGVSPGWDPILRMMNDIGWGTVMERVKSFVKGLTLMEVAEKFRDPDKALIEKVIQNWRDQPVPKETLTSPRLQTVPEAAAAFCVYVSGFREGRD